MYLQQQKWNNFSHMDNHSQFPSWFGHFLLFFLVLQTPPTAFELQEKDVSRDSKFALHVRQIRYFLNGWLKCDVNGQYDKSST